MKKYYIFIIFAIFAMFNMAIAANLVIESNTQEVDASNNTLNLEGDIKVQLDNIIIQAPKAKGNLDPKTKKLLDVDFLYKPYAFQVQGDKKNEVKADIINVSLLKNIITAKGNTQSNVIQNNQPIVIINSETQEYNTKIDQMKAIGNVIILYKDVKTFSNQAVIDITRKGQLKKLQLIGNAKIEQKDNKANADKFTYNAITKDIMSIGNTYTLMNMDNGDKIEVWAQFQQINQASNTMTASKNVKVIYKDYTALGPKASVFSDSNKKFNKIVFTGRSKIIQEGRTIEADKIIMTLNPKNFFAEGNVKTVIPNVNSNDAEL